ncbi:MAG: hypothetical protein V3V08_11690 [Nannocystaceae bacterium]
MSSACNTGDVDSTGAATPPPESKAVVTQPVLQSVNEPTAELLDVSSESEEEELPPGPPLTKEEKALIAQKVKDLSPEDRRKRAYAMRKKIMQTPNSPVARQLRKTAEAIRNGEIQLPPELLKKGSALKVGEGPRGGGGSPI